MLSLQVQEERVRLLEQEVSSKLVLQAGGDNHKEFLSSPCLLAEEPFLFDFG